MSGNDVLTRRYRSAGGVVTDQVGQQVLVLVRPKRLGPDGRPEVRLPKGHIQAGESREACALREVGEESGYVALDILADLGDQQVEFDWQAQHIIREEAYFLLRLRADASPSGARGEAQFEVEWLPWSRALVRLTFESERDAVERGWHAWQALHAQP